jgi:lysozyme
MAQTFQPSINFVNLVHGSEGCRLTAYRDSGDVLTIGWGHTGKDVYEGQVITLDQANRLFISDCSVDTNWLNMTGLCQKQNQFDACMDLLYNIGIGHFKNDENLMNALKNQNANDIKDAFMKHVIDGATGLKLAGLVTRRESELKLFFT